MFFLVAYLSDFNGYKVENYKKAPHHKKIFPKKIGKDTNKVIVIKNVLFKEKLRLYIAIFKPQKLFLQKSKQKI